MARHPEQTRRRLEQTATRLRSLVHSETIAPASLTVSERTGSDGWGAARELAHRPVELGEEFVGASPGQTAVLMEGETIVGHGTIVAPG